MTITRSLGLAWLVFALAGLAGCQTQRQVKTDGKGPSEAAESAKIEVAKVQAGDPLAAEFDADPAAMLAKGLAWYDANVRDYTCVLYKKERIEPSESDFRPEQKLECKFREQPYSVFTHTVVNPGGATKALYVEGQWNNQMKVRTTILRLPVTVEVEPQGPQARKETLRFINQFGFKRSLTAIIDATRLARGEGIWQGEVVGAGKVGDRDVLIFDSQVTEPAPSGRFDMPRVRIFLDREWRLPLAVYIWDANGIARGEYRFEQINFNVGLTDQDFTPKANGM